MQNKIIKIWKKQTGFPPVRYATIDTLEKWQQEVNGNIECVQYNKDITIICNEEGRINKMPFNCKVGGFDFYGPIIFIGTDGEEFMDCPYDDEMFRKEFGYLFNDEED